MVRVSAFGVSVPVAAVRTGDAESRRDDALSRRNAIGHDATLRSHDLKTAALEHIEVAVDLPGSDLHPVLIPLFALGIDEA